jgi:CRISPR-associated protein Csd2
LISKENTPRFDIFIKQGVILNQQIEKAYNYSEEVKKGLEEWMLWTKNKKKVEKPKRHYEDIAKDWMCDNFYDVRTFGAVMSTGSDKEDNSKSDENSDTSSTEKTKSKIRMTAGQVRGPVQINFAKSVEQITPLEISMSRVCAASEDKPEQFGLGPRKGIVPYALYRVEGYISAKLAEQTGFSEDDRNLLWEALANMLDHDHSAARGKMNARKLVVFKHESSLGNAPAHKLFEHVVVDRVTDKNLPARSFSDYSIRIESSGIPQGVSLEEKL